MKGQEKEEVGFDVQEILIKLVIVGIIGTTLTFAMLPVFLAGSVEPPEQVEKND